MTSLEILIKDFFRRKDLWRRWLIGGVAMYLFLPFGYFRWLSRGVHSGQPEGKLPPQRALLGMSIRAWPLGAFYSLVPLAIAWSLTSILYLLMLELLVPIVWGLAIMASLSLTAVALTVVKDDPQRYFLGLDFENVLEKWWEMRRVLLLPCLICYGAIALLSTPLYGFAMFFALDILVRIVSQSSREDLS